MDIYIQKLQRVNEKLHEKLLALVNCRKVILLDDNARPHIEREVQETILQLHWFVSPHASCSPDLAATYYQHFCPLQNFLNGKIFKSEEQVRQTVEEFFENKPTALYTDDIHKLPEG